MEWLNQFLYEMSDTASLSVEIIVGRLLIAAVLAVFIGFISYITYRGDNYHSSFFYAQIIMTIIGALILMIVGNSVARAFGLMGAMNLIRFSARIEDPKDIALIFYAVAVGLACGSGLALYAIIGVVIVTIILLLFRFTPLLYAETCLLEFDYLQFTEAKALIETTLQDSKIKNRLFKVSNKDMVYKIRAAVPEGASIAEKIRSLKPEIIPAYRVKES